MAGTSRRAPLRIHPFRKIVTDAPVSYSVYSALSFYGVKRGGELPGPWLVRALGELGHATAAIRQTIYRMEATSELQSRIDGRTKYYRLTPPARAEAQAGLAKIMEEEPERWDGIWTLVHVASESHGRAERERLLEIIRAEGFAPMGKGYFLHPRDRTARLIAAASESGVGDMLEVFRATRVGGEPSREIAARYWDLSALSRQYDRFLARYRPVLANRRPIQPRAAFVLRFAVVLDFLETAWRDPNLTWEFLPRDWPGIRAQRAARALYRRLLPAAIAHADLLIVECGFERAARATRVTQRGSAEIPRASLSRKG
jgi:phenylacetic acid degradation operon negative regulatory protein